MAKKRFTDIEIWDKEWYMDLKPVHKCLMKYIFDKCDASGCWKPNWKLASVHIGDDVNFSDLSNLPKEQYEILESGKIFIPDFISFQYGRLSKECKPHAQIISILDKNEILDRFIDFIDESGTSVKALRKRLTETAKKEIFEQDDYQCQYCGERPGVNFLFVDHIIALTAGGNNSDENLTTSCKSCNAKKHDDSVFEFLHKHNITPLNSLNKKLDTLYKNKNTLQEKEKDIYKEIDIEEDRTTEKIILWEKVVENFGNDFRWKEKFCRDKNVRMPELESKMKEFVSDIELREKFKELKELKDHFFNWFTKNKNGNGFNKTNNTLSPSLQKLADEREMARLKHQK